MVDTLLLITEK